MLTMRIGTHFSNNLTESLTKPPPQLRDMEHENIVKFYGICVEQSKVCTVYSHCPKGSLQDVLQNEKLNLDVMFQQSFITDMVKVRWLPRDHLDFSCSQNWRIKRRDLKINYNFKK